MAVSCSGSDYSQVFAFVAPHFHDNSAQSHPNSDFSVLVLRVLRHTLFLCSTTATKRI